MRRCGGWPAAAAKARACALSGERNGRAVAFPYADQEWAEGQGTQRRRDFGQLSLPVGRYFELLAGLILVDLRLMVEAGDGEEGGERLL